MTITPSPSFTSRLLRAALRFGFAAAVIGGVALGVALIHARAGAGIAVVEPPRLGVLTTRLEAERGYAVTRRYAGRLEPARETALGFERAGRLAAVLADEGAEVAEGAPLARLDTAELEVERDRLAAVRRQLKAAVELARLTSGRQQALTNRAASDQRRDEARLGLAEAEARLAEVAALIDRVEIDLAKSVLRAPFAGRIAARIADEGAILAGGSPVFSLVEAARPRARIGLPPEVAEGLALGDAHPIEVGGSRVTGRLVAKRPDLDTASRTVAALFELEAAAGGFGAVATLALETPVDATGYWAPVSALVEGARGTWTLYALAVDGPEARIVREAVEVLSVRGDRAYLRGAMPDGTRIVADGTHRVRPGQTVPLLLAAE